MTSLGNDLLDRLRRLDAACLSDAGKPALRALPPEIRPVAPGHRMVGRAVTADAGDDLMSVLGALHAAGPGDVLVIATGGARHAVGGELFATEALRRGIAGMVIDGFCRDLATLVRLPLPVFARGATPEAAPAVSVPRVMVPVAIGDTEVAPGDLVIGDDDGIVVGTEAAFADAVAGAEAILRREEALRLSIAEGGSLFDWINYVEHAQRLRDGTASSFAFHA